MSYRWVEHTADVELHMEAPDERGIFESALEALGELIGEQAGAEPGEDRAREQPLGERAGAEPGEDRAREQALGERAGGEQVGREVTVAAGDRAALLAAWLEELVFMAETEDLVPEHVESLELEEGRLRASVRAHRGRPRHLVKGVTYHRLAFESSGGRFTARVVLDV